VAGMTVFVFLPARRQSIIPTILHISPAGAMSQYLDTAGFNFSAKWLSPFKN
jgi:hypothetical protein